MKKVDLTKNCTADEQESGFMNATLQDAGNVAFSIATHIKIPENVSSQGEDAVSSYLAELLEKASNSVEGLSFTVQTGPAEAEECLPRTHNNRER